MGLLDLLGKAKFQNGSCDNKRWQKNFRKNEGLDRKGRTPLWRAQKKRCITQRTYRGENECNPERKKKDSRENEKKKKKKVILGETQSVSRRGWRGKKRVAINNSPSDSETRKKKEKGYLSEEKG